MNPVDQLLNEISDVANAELWHQLPALDDKIRSHFENAIANCPAEQSQQLLNDIDRTSKCYANVIDLCKQHSANLQAESAKLSQQKTAIKGYTANFSG